MRLCVLASLVLVACSSTSPPPSPQPSSTASSPAAPVDTSTPSFAVVQRVCAAPCAGPLARVRVLRDAGGKVGRIRLDGDLGRCSHPPRIYFDAEGNEVLTIPEEPVEPGSARQQELTAKQAAVVEGLVEAERLGCTDPAACEPARTEGFRSELPCRSDGDCVSCQCRPVDRAEWQRRGGEEACTDPNAECIATNPVCCDGKCMLAR